MPSATRIDTLDNFKLLLKISKCVHVCVCLSMCVCIYMCEKTLMQASTSLCDAIKAIIVCHVDTPERNLPGRLP